MIAVEGFDPECLTAETLESYTRRIAAAWRSFDKRFRLYQYFVKQSHTSISADSKYRNAAVECTVSRRVEYLQTKSNGPYSVQIYYVVLFEPRPLQVTTLSRKKTLRHLQRSLNAAGPR